MREILQALVQVRSRRLQIDQAEKAVTAATGSYDKNVARIREGQGLPLEVLQSLQALDLSRREYPRAVTEYNEAQFRLHRALGWSGDTGCCRWVLLAPPVISDSRFNTA